VSVYADPVRRPEFLVIGAMKAGSTTLYEDLRGLPGIFLPEKELHTLGEPDAGARYADLLADARADQVTGEVSATYAKLPQTAGLAERARELLGPELRVVYLVRDPVDRTVSHHFHRLARGRTVSSVDEAVRGDDRFVDYSRYAMQLQPWLDVLGTDRIHLVHFERYVDDRAAVLAEVAAFLGVPAGSGADLDAVHNRGDQRPVAVGLRGRLSRTSAYRRYVRPHLPEATRRRLARAVLPTAPPRPAPPSADTVDFILSRTAEDAALLRELFGDRAPTWDADATRARYVRLRAS
jgi:hypothetical protein